MDPIKQRLPFKQWFETVPEEKRDTANYRLRYAYENNLIPQDQLDNFVSNKDAHLMSAYQNPKTGNYDFIKSRNHPTHALELDWYNGKTKEASKFRKQYDYVQDESGFDSYVQKKGSKLPGFKDGVTGFKQESLANDNTKVAPRRVVPEPIVNTSSEFLFTGPKKVVDTSKGKLETKVVGGFESKRNPNARIGLVDVSPEFEVISALSGLNVASALNKVAQKTMRNRLPAVADVLADAVEPKLIRAMRGDVLFDDAGNIVLGSRDKAQNLLKIGDDKYTTHFSTDMPVRAHKKGDWSGMDLVVTDMKGVRAQADIKSIEPMDTFFEAGKNIVGNKSSVYVTGNADKISSVGKNMEVLTSRKLQKIYNDGMASLKADVDAADPLMAKYLARGQAKFDQKYRDAYTKEAQRLINRKYGMPIKRDYTALEKSTGMKSGVEKLKGQPKDVTRKLNSMEEYQFPNGGYANEQYANRLKRQPLNNLFYDPSPTVHSDWMKGLK